MARRPRRARGLCICLGIFPGTLRCDPSELLEVAYPLAIMRIGQDRIAVDAFLAPRLAHELVQLARRQLLAPATELVYILTPFTRRRPPGRP